MPMFSFKNKQHHLPEDDLISRLGQFVHLQKSHPLELENFLDSLVYFAKIIRAENASVYLFEDKTNMFLLKKWVGRQPTRFSVSGRYEFVEYLKSGEAVTFREDFSKKNLNELRQAALFYFQETVSNVTCPLAEQNCWRGLLNAEVNSNGPLSRKVVGYFFDIYADLIKRWLAYQHVQNQSKKLSHLAHIKNELLTNVTHELKTPIHGVLGVAQAVLDDEALADCHAQIKLIFNSATELDKTVGNILELAKIEARRDEAKREKVDLAALVAEVADLFHDTCQKKNIILAVPPLEGHKINLYAQSDQIRTALMNLIGNAVKFTEKGQISVDFKKSGEMVHLSVCDTGIGIDKDKLDLVFEEFYQADGSQTRVYGGTGLGLAITKKIVELHGGRIRVESQKGAGSVFTLTLPLYPV